jgi:undecaprenyl-diphosphatase
MPEISSGRRAVATARAARPGWALWAVGAGLLLVAWSLAVARHGVPGWEQAVFRVVNRAPGWLYRPMWIVQLLGVIVVPLVAAAVAAALRRWRLAVALALVAPLKLAVELDVLKKLVQRQRPGRTELAPILRDVPSAGLSYPSGHAIVAFAIATLLAPYLRPAGRVAVFAIAAAVCLARVYLGAHNPLDVVSGAGAGLVLGGLLTLLLGVRRRT